MKKYEMSLLAVALFMLMVSVHPVLGAMDQPASRSADVKVQQTEAKITQLKQMRESRMDKIYGKIETKRNEVAAKLARLKQERAEKLARIKAEKEAKEKAVKEKISKIKAEREAKMAKLKNQKEVKKPAVKTQITVTPKVTNIQVR